MPSLAWNRDDALQDKLIRKAFRRDVRRPVHYVPTAEGFGAAVRAGLGWGMYPEQLVTADFVQISPIHLDVPLFWQSWKLDSALVASIGRAVSTAARILRCSDAQRQMTHGPAGSVGHLHLRYRYQLMPTISWAMALSRAWAAETTRCRFLWNSS